MRGLIGPSVPSPSSPPPRGCSRKKRHHHEIHLTSQNWEVWVVGGNKTQKPASTQLTMSYKHAQMSEPSRGE